MADEPSFIRIGLEVHCQLTSLRTKLFCGCATNYRDAPPNTHTCPVCLGMPGTLPALNGRAVEDSIMVALALNAQVQGRTIFFRKNYYYPDMPKNFQISQYDRAGGVPIATGGSVSIQLDHAEKTIRIRRVQLEEDPGKLVHQGPIDTSPYTLVDYNRSGVALLEIVTEPDLGSPKEARIFLTKLRSILEHLGVSDGRLEGAMRCDANISLAGGRRVEVKNISSFKEVERALNFEIARQRSLLSVGGKVEMETRHWDEVRRVTVTLRAKEEEHDYRYFPESDLVPVMITKEKIEGTKARMPELPDARRERFVGQYKLPSYDAGVLTSDKALADFFEECAKLYSDAKQLSNWVMTDLLRSLHEQNIEIGESKITPRNLIGMIKLIDNGTISGKIAKRVLPEVVKTGKPSDEVVEEMGLIRIASRRKVEEVAEQVFKEYPQAVQDALTDEKAVNFLVGQVMRLTEGRADPQLTNQVIRYKLKGLRQA